MDGLRSGQGGPDAANRTNGSSRAERFEDEKQRIIESCFGKKDVDGSFPESYITHIRIVEDAAYPSSPPPPSSGPGAKKPRIIIVAVRKSGRVRMHKARENVNGTFSIGKTWPLDDLTAVESFNGATPRNSEEEQRKQWAGGVGFIVSIGKPYYWQANTQKEKQFFIASLVKIFTKYTGGKSPELIGFDEKETEQLLGITSQARQLPANNQNLTPVQAPPTPNSPQAQLRGARRTPISQDPPPLRQQTQASSGVAQSATSQATRSPVQPKREDSPSSGIDYTGVTPQQSQSSLRRIAAGNYSQESLFRGDDANGPRPRSRGGANGMPFGSGRFPDRSMTPASRTITPEDASNINDASSIIPPIPEPLALPPERRRPPIQVSNTAPLSGQDGNMVPAPLVSPGMRRADIRPPVRGNERPQSPTVERVSEIGNPAASRIAGKQSKPELHQSADTPSETQKGISREYLPTIPSVAAVHSAIASNPIDSPDSPAQVTEDSPIPTPDEERPGLGPMIKKKKSKAEIANTFRKAANAANSFKPRVGGAAERLREQQAKQSEGPDGITSVVPAPSLVRNTNDGSTKSATPNIVKDTTVAANSNEGIPEVKVTGVQSRPTSVEAPAEGKSDDVSAEKGKGRETRRQKPTSEVLQKELESLGVDSSILDSRATEFASFLDEFGWVGEGVRTRDIDQMKEDIEREINTAQAGGWLSRLEEEDERIEAIQKGIDFCITECDELDGLLTLYSVELGTLNEDVAYIEAQSQGLQVQASNQKLLKAELQSLLETISISPAQLQSLQEASLESSRGLEQIEGSLVILFKAMVTIDPSLSLFAPQASEDGSMRSGKVGGFGNSEIGSMRVLQEKKDTYRDQSIQFLRRLKPFLQVKFGAAIEETKMAIDRDNEGSLSKRMGKAKLDPKNHDLSRNSLWKYSPLMLFSREIARTEWEEIVKIYETVCNPVYQDEFKTAFSSWKNAAKKSTGDESDFLFSSQIEKPEGLTGRKLTVKRSGTLRFRSDTASKINVDKIPDGRPNYYEVFGIALDEIFPVMITEQNFIVEFFHISSLEFQDFPDAVTATAPDDRHGSDLRKPKPVDPNRDLGKKVVQSMEEMFSFFPREIQDFIKKATDSDPLQGVGILAAIERKLAECEETNQEYLVRTLQRQHSMLMGLFNAFLDEQIRAIEDTKVKINKRKGVIAFIRIFPSFSAAIEAMLVSTEELEIREKVNAAYGRINKSMFESLKTIAREIPSATTAGATMGDPEDKEALNYQILLIENMNHYVEEVDAKSNSVLEEWKEKAAQELDEHLSLYLGAVIRRPLGKLLDFIESVESLLLSLPAGSAPSSIAERTSHSKTFFKKLLTTYDSKEIRRGIEKLKMRVEKHFGDADDPGLSKGLVAKVIDTCEKYYINVEERVDTIKKDIYDGDVGIEWTRSDVTTSFKR